MDIREFSLNLQKLYWEMSESFSQYQSFNGLHCLSGCGRCCQNPEIEASILEMIPMALKIYDEGKLEEWLSQLENRTQEICLSLQSTGKNGQGQCRYYEQRPSICRMFGVGGIYNKYHEVTLSICRYIKETIPAECEKAQEFALSNGAPMIAQWSTKLITLNPDLIRERRPINEALKYALHKVAFYLQFQEDNSQH